MEYAIETEHLTKVYGSATVVDHINLHLPKGKMYGLLGRNGAGKTTAMKMMLRLVSPTEGTIRLFGTSQRENTRALYGKIGSMIETPGFYGNLTGFENLQILAKLRGQLADGAAKRALHLVGLDKETKKVFADYSLGMKQRLGIAAAMMHEPALLILDEPTNGLDPIGISEMRALLSELSRSKGTTILLSSHALSEIEQIADRIGVMHEGRLLEEVDLAVLHRRNRHYTELDVSDGKKAAEILKRCAPAADHSVAGNTVRVSGVPAGIGEINKAFVENGLSVTRICTNEENLENYFSHLIGGGGIA